MTGGPLTNPRDLAMHPWPMHPMPALFVSLVMPWRACSGAWRQAGVWHSLLYHGVGLVGFFVGLFILDQALWYGDMFDELTNAEPGELAVFLLGVAVWLIAIELGYLLAALLTSCWGAEAGAYRHDLGRSLSRWYQLTPFHAVWTLGLIVGIDVIDEMRYSGGSWDYGSLRYELHALIFSAITLGVFLLYYGVGGWFTLRALAVPRDRAAYYPKSRWPALCETCGYALVGLSREQGCPECGRPINSSLNTPRGNTPQTLIARMVMAVFQPSALGERLPTRTRTPGPARALAITALLLLATGPIGVGLIVLITQVAFGEFWMDSPYEAIRSFLIGGLGTGLGAMVVGIFIVLAVGSLSGLIERVLGKRSNLPAACHAACYASGYVVLLALTMYTFIALLVVAAERFLSHLGYGLIAVIPLTLIGFCLLLCLPYCVIVGRAVRAMRYANA